jgi:MarR-like DNA-binding transcriptional regulator SgrR of sgrS sRNA
VEIRGGEGGDAVAIPAPGAFDVAFAWGRAAADLLEEPGLDVRADRLPAWDTVYGLWLASDRRWTNDPAFRRWLRDLLDRERMARHLFGEHAEPAFGLSPVGPGVSGRSGRRPFSQGSSPRLTLAFDEADPHAASLAARLKAVLLPHGVDLRVAAHPAGGLSRALAETGFHGVVLAHRPLADEPLLALVETLWPLRTMFGEETTGLLRATRIADPDRRQRRAEEVEAGLIADARLIPLVRLHAWRLRAADVERVDTGSRGRVRLDRARWSR